MIVEVSQNAANPTHNNPYNFRVGFRCELHEAEAVIDWMDDNKLTGSRWHTRNGLVLYTVETEAIMCALRWA
jgi:hypothetical protein